MNTNGTIKIGVLYSPTSLNPATSTAGLDALYLSMVYDTLIGVNPKNGDLQPMLATSWHVAGVSRLQWDVFLRKGVKFQDGTPLTAQAVVDYSKAYLAAGDIGNALQYVTNVSAVGKYEVVYRLSQQNSQLPFGLASKGGMIPSPTAVAKEGSSFATNPVGAGPYSFTSEVAGSSYSFTRFNGYWNNAHQPRIQNITFDVFQSDTSLVTAIQSGDVNIASGVQATDVSTLKSNPGLVTAVGPGTHFNMAYFNSNVAPFTNVDLRIAFNLALNRQAMMTAATDGTGQVQTEFTLPGQPGYVKSLAPLFPYNPTKAAQLVKQAGYPNGVSMTCYEQPGQGYDIIGPIIVAEEAAVGINVTLLPGGPTVVAPFFTKNTSPCLLAQGSGNGDPVYANLGLWSQSYYNASHTDFGADKDFVSLFRTYKASQQAQLFYNINLAFQKNPGFSVFYTAPFVNVYQKSVGGWIISPLTLDNWQSLYYKG